MAGRKAAAVAEVKPDEISKEIFVAELREAREKAGSTFELALKIETHPRRITKWLAGEGPTYKRMQEMYYKLKELEWKDED